ncbi:hypothetical protein N7E81_10220 [Reichenbachiella carrageenanivorans]|uniref:Fibrobacter succinogenes major paralogous domain-containing protein n=1 Tax=Reichenbachiella carrageenanivorans TaxID=2979869 RepID=A0ABY6CV11_9BACT|nr:FISUMP domain-containing protein [Reichenbachiella carrageenanivorans]UXX77744.1 hypothetical protein N7E81_10220 [Reichenbachiella carrageenanivorans]
MNLTKPFYDLGSKIFSVLFFVLMTATMISCSSDEAEEITCKFTAAATVADDKITLTLTDGKAPFAYVITYTGGATQEGTTSDNPATITANENEDAAIAISDANKCTATATATQPEIECELKATAVASDGTITLTLTGGKSPYAYVITYDGGTTQEGTTSDNPATITADENKDATISITDADDCTATTQVTAEDLTSLLDTRDDQRYKIVTIGTQTWLAENFNYDATGSLCYDDDATNCETYGKLYDWATATADDFAPEGWRLPTKDERDALKTFLGDDSGTKLKEGGSSGFEALLGGALTSDFLLEGTAGYFWTSTAESEVDAYYFYVNASVDIKDNFNAKTSKFYARLIRG